MQAFLRFFFCISFGVEKLPATRYKLPVAGLWSIELGSFNSITDEYIEQLYRMHYRENMLKTYTREFQNYGAMCT